MLVAKFNLKQKYNRFEILALLLLEHRFVVFMQQYLLLSVFYQQITHEEIEDRWSEKIKITGKRNLHICIDRSYCVRGLTCVVSFV